LRAAYSSIEAATAIGAGNAGEETSDRDPIPQSAREIAEARLAALSRDAGVEDPKAKPAIEPVWEPVLADEPLADLLEAAELQAAEPQTDKPRPGRPEVDQHVDQQRAQAPAQEAKISTAAKAEPPEAERAQPEQKTDAQPKDAAASKDEARPAASAGP